MVLPFEILLVLLKQCLYKVSIFYGLTDFQDCSFCGCLFSLFCKMSEQQIRFLENFGLVPNSSKVVDADPIVLRKIRQLLTDKALKEILDELVPERPEEETSPQFPNLQVGSSRGSLSHGVWLTSSLFVKCHSEQCARNIFNMFEALKVVPLRSMGSTWSHSREQW